METHAIGCQDFVKCEMGHTRSRACRAMVGSVDEAGFCRIKNKTHKARRSCLDRTSNQWRRACRRQLLLFSARC